MVPNDPSPSEYYSLATGEAGAARLRLLDAVYGAASRSFLLRVGVVAGMRVADIGCGTGNVCCWLAEQVGQEGQVTGVDVSAAQLIIAAKEIRARTLGNVVLRRTDIYDPDLPKAAFDLVYTRVTLCHLRRPCAALSVMRSLLRPGGTLACEDMDSISVVTEPNDEGYARYLALEARMTQALGVDFEMGLKLPAMMRSAGVEISALSCFQPMAESGEAKRFLEYSLAESIATVVSAGIALKAEVEDILTAMRRVNDDPCLLLALPRMTQVAGILRR
jgi:ubiquinone/menaquinone biosynthesis C-methylase UbiE